ncbi:unnamed protein product, partial [Arabidopsis halleri]
SGQCTFFVVFKTRKDVYDGGVRHHTVVYTYLKVGDKGAKHSASSVD